MRYLTKSRFKLGHECPTKLFYTRKPKEYADAKMEDDFLRTLAEGGHLVGELAKLYFPNGHEVETLDHELALKKTNELLANENTVIFEAAIKFGNLFIRVDVLVKTGRSLQLIEVKSKSFDSSLPDPFLTTTGLIDSDFKKYLLDVAFQKHVVTSEFPDFDVSSHLMLVDMSQPCSVDGLNQRFRIRTDDTGRTKFVYDPGNDNAGVCKKILSQVPVDGYFDQLFEQCRAEFHNESFVEHIQWLADHYERDHRIPAVLGRKCKNCEFRCSGQDGHQDLKDGFRECWTEVLGWNGDEFDQPLIFDLYNLHHRKADQLIDNQKVRIQDLNDDDIVSTANDKPGLSESERRALHVQYVRELREDSHIDRVGLQNEMNSWRFPLNFIDFETLLPAVPLHKGSRPYKYIAFQFSHHAVQKDGTVNHVNEYLNDTPGAFPNFDFLRKLKSSLENDIGTVFRYADHENTILNHIIDQLDSVGRELPDYSDLRKFAKDLTHSKKGHPDPWTGARDMVDLRVLVARHYFHPLMKGSQSLKFVLPAMLVDSDYLKQKYSQPIYGSETNGIKSHNFKNHSWVKFDDGGLVNPYRQLPNIFDEISNDKWSFLEELNAIKEGGTAMTAYLRLQYEDLPDEYRQRIRTGLLKYCELDTLAMVMIYEGWREMLR